MAARGQGRQVTNKRQTTYQNTGRNRYNAGNTAKQLDVTKAIREEPKKQLSHAARKNRDKARHMNPGYVLFLMGALMLAGFVLIGYIRLQSDITNSITNISKLESQLNNLRLENDEEYSRVQSAVDLEEIKRIAIQELGMTYAREGQVVEFSAEGNDYVRQVGDIPQ